MSDTLFVVHRINPSCNQIEVVAICDDQTQAKIELNEATADFFNKKEKYSVIKESDTRINIYLKQTGWISNGKILIEILDICEFEITMQNSES